MQNLDNPSDFATQAFQEFLFSPHPYSRIGLGKRQDVARLKKTQIIRFYLENVRPNNSLLAVVGDFPETILSQLESALKTWRPRNIKPLNYEVPAPITGLQFRLVHKSDLNQTQVRMGHEGVPRTNKDYLTLRVANLILGQGFTSRLVDHIRDNLGLTYHIATDLEAMLNTGSFEISTFTRSEKTGVAISEILKVYKKFVDEGVTPQEVENAKGFLQGGFGRSLETAERLAFNLLLLRNYGVPDTYLTRFEDNVENISVADVNRVVKTYFRPEQMRVLILANQGLVLSQLKQWEPVEIKSPKDLL
jgi:zinc protease